MSSKKVKKYPKRQVALCYVRLSYTRDDEDKNSPERQRANIEAFLKRKGWIGEWYEDVGGHKSARKEVNRPEWLRLKARLADPDVVALVANDLSRLHRKGWRVGDLVDYLEKQDLALVLAAPGREVDTSTAMGRLFIQFTAIIDEYYAEDISQRAKDSVSYRKARGISIGRPPFGTIRGQDGYLQPSQEGAWLLADGSFAKGTADEPPEDGAIWRHYYEAAERILFLYATGNYGLEKIAYKLNEEAWAYRDRTGEPRSVYRDDVRRVVANWPEYGGIVMDKKAKDRRVYEGFQADEIPFNPERAVFPLDVLRSVARTRQERTIRRSDEGVNKLTHFYPLSAITYCAHCVRRAAAQDDPRLRSALGGSDTYGKIRYRHKAGVKCGCHNRSVLCEIYEADFERLIKLLTIRPEKLELMTRLAIEFDKANGFFDEERDLEQEKEEAIALSRRRIEAAVVLFGDGMISPEEYRRRVELNEREIAHWQARTTETEKVALELAMCAEALDKLVRLWDISNEEDRQGLVRSLFDEIVYDLDTQRIVDFRLKPWADRYVVLRAALYEEDDGEGDGTTSGAGDFGDADAPQATLSTNEAAGELESPMGHKSLVVLRPERLCFSGLCSPLTPLSSSLDSSPELSSLGGSAAPSSSPYNAARSSKNRLAQGLRLKSTICCLSRS
ncbi:recombinase family protein [Aggregatilinea lenta]|uniref:recombinase family protein n=1 Tax=Aggregatilinea lenta TaxID=913108 RepID=UPI000E5BE69F|nr:recombinase family protein [Aggregatilinea lenta]